MSANSSSSSNACLPPSPLSSSVSTYHQLHKCLNTTVGIFSITAFTISSIFILLPLYILVLYLGLQRWHQQRSSQTMSHSDVFTYHMVAIELTSVFGSILLCCGFHTDLPQVMMLGLYLFSINVSGQMFFHILTCVERYLAVVHPITYLKLKKTNGIRLRNVTIGCAWLLCFAGTVPLSADEQFYMNILTYCFVAFAIVVVSFCSLSVLCVLIRPGPGEGGRGRQRVDQSKLKPFYTIMVILGVLLVRFGGNLLATAMSFAALLGENELCALWFSVIWLCLPSSLVLPLLFLQKAGKLLCCKKNNRSGQGSD